MPDLFDSGVLLFLDSTVAFKIDTTKVDRFPRNLMTSSFPVCNLRSSRYSFTHPYVNALKLSTFNLYSISLLKLLHLRRRLEEV